MLLLLLLLLLLLVLLLLLLLLLLLSPLLLLPLLFHFISLRQGNPSNLGDGGISPTTKAKHLALMGTNPRGASCLRLSTRGQQRQVSVRLK